MRRSRTRVQAQRFQDVLLGGVHLAHFQVGHTQFAAGVRVVRPLVDEALIKLGSLAVPAAVGGGHSLLAHLARAALAARRRFKLDDGRAVLDGDFEVRAEKGVQFSQPVDGFGVGEFGQIRLLLRVDDDLR
jgi:hypothetical protein